MLQFRDYLLTIAHGQTLNKRVERISNERLQEEVHSKNMAGSLRKQIQIAFFFFFQNKEGSQVTQYTAMLFSV